jgi:hypothetical protein
MGYALGWVAVQGGRADAIHEKLGVLRTGTREDVPEAPVVGAILPNGWYLVAVQRGEHLLGDALLSDLSAGTHAIACFVEEHVMYSASVGWSDGRKMWSVVHDSEQAAGHLAVDGSVPADFSQIRATQEAKQRTEDEADAEVDYIFDVPIDLAKALTGFRHDESVAGSDPAPFEVLAPRAGATRAWWKKWLGQ